MIEVITEKGDKAMLLMHIYVKTDCEYLLLSDTTNRVMAQMDGSIWLTCVAAYSTYNKRAM